jgi:dienelactone hydrolase
MRIFACVAAGVLALTVPAYADTVTIPASGSLPAITGNLMRPAGPGPFPAVLVLHGCEGIGSLETKTVAELAKQGYVALAIDTLGPQGIKNACTNPEAFVTSARYAYVTLAWLAAQPFVIPDHLGAIGFSMGAMEILGLIDPVSPRPPPPGLKVAVAYYPACDRRSPNVGVPLQILDGAADDWNAAPPCQALAQSATAAGHTVQITTYPGATHAFNQPSDHTRTYLGHTLTYNADADRDADAKTNAFLATYLK